MRRHSLRLATLAAALAVMAPMAATAQEGWIFGFDLGAAIQDRDPFVFGALGTHAESGDPTIFEQWSIDHTNDDVGFNGTFMFGHRVNDRDGWMFRLGYLDFSNGEHRLHRESDFEVDGVALMHPWLDGPVEGAEQDARRTDGIIGERYLDADAVLSYDWQAYEFGGDWMRTLKDDEKAIVNFLLGGWVLRSQQDFTYDAFGLPAPDAEADSLVWMGEDLDEWYYGPHVGVNGKVYLNDALSVAFDWRVDAALYFRDSDYDGLMIVHRPDGAELETTVEVDDDGFSPRLIGGFGFSWAAGSAWLGIQYRAEYWWDVAKIERPLLVFDSGIMDGPVWNADTHVFLGEESFFMQMLLFTIRWGGAA